MNEMKELNEKELDAVSGGSGDVPPRYFPGQTVRFSWRGTEYTGVIWNVKMERVWM